MKKTYVHLLFSHFHSMLRRHIPGAEFILPRTACLPLLIFVGGLVISASPASAVPAKAEGYASFYWRWTPSQTSAMDFITPTIRACWAHAGDELTMMDDESRTATWSGITSLQNQMEEAFKSTWMKYGKIDFEFQKGISSACDI